VTLAAQHLTVRRGGKAIVDDVSLSLALGKLVALIGANGAGKSTLLAALAGLLAPDSGTVTLDGANIDSLPARDLAKARAYLPQNARAEWPISVERIVALGLTPHLPAFGGLSPALQEKVAAALAACDLADRATQAADTLSGGELARAMLARALVGEPRILIVDEPMSGLDPRHKLDTIARLTAYARGGSAVICSTHDLTLAARNADRVIVMAHGRVLADGPTAEAMTAETLSAAFDVTARVVNVGHADALVDFQR
jgi:iron complex transport system ATP-binding protein